MRSLDIYQDWQQYHGRKVQIDGLTYTLAVSTWTARYPYPREVISVQAACDKRTAHYRAERSKLGDDWTIDILDSDIELQADILAQLQTLP